MIRRILTAAVVVVLLGLFGIWLLSRRPLVLPQLPLCLLEVLYVRAGSVPPYNFPAFVPKRRRTNKKPTIDSVIAANTSLNFAGFSRAQLLLPFFHQRP